MRTHASLPFRAAALVLLLALAPGCSTWVSQPLAPAAVLRQPAPAYGKVRLVRTNGEAVVVRNPIAAGDSVFGVRVQHDQPSRPIAVPLSEIREVQTIRADLAETALLVAGIGAGAFLGLMHMIGRSTN